MRQPHGKGLFVRSWRVTALLPSNPSASSFALAFRAAGFSWAAPVALGGTVVKLRQRDYWQAMRDNDIRCFGTWVLPEPGPNTVDMARRLVADMHSLGADGVINDPELQYKGHPEQARELHETLRSECRDAGLTLGFTSYSVPDFHPDFPWHAFSDSDFALAQTYDRDNRFDPDYFRTAIAGYQEKGFRNVFPCFGLNDHRTGQSKTVPNLRKHLSLIPASDAVCGWGPPTISRAQWRVLSGWRNGGIAGNNGGSAGIIGASILAVLLGLAALKG